VSTGDDCPPLKTGDFHFKKGCTTHTHKHKWGCGLSLGQGGGKTPSCQNVEWPWRSHSARTDPSHGCVSTWGCLSPIGKWPRSWVHFPHFNPLWHDQHRKDEESSTTFLNGCSLNAAYTTLCIEPWKNEMHYEKTIYSQGKYDMLISKDNSRDWGFTTTSIYTDVLLKTLARQRWLTVRWQAQRKNNYSWIGTLTSGALGLNSRAEPGT